jgi:hypothetical protein
MAQAGEDGNDEYGEMMGTNDREQDDLIMEGC